MDMTPFIASRSDQLNADDLVAGPRTITVARVVGNDSADQPVSVHYEGDNGKPFKPCRTMRRVMVAVWGKDASSYAGKAMTIYRDAEVAFGGMKVGGIRISHMSGLTEKKQLALTATRGKKALHTVLPLTDTPKPAERNFDAELSQLRALARPGNMDALSTAWQDIGPDARKALALELPGLKAACQSESVEPDDVPFDGPAQQGGPAYDGV